MARPLIAGRGHRDLSLYRNFILNDHRWSSNTSKSAHKQKRTFESGIFYKIYKLAMAISAVMIARADCRRCITTWQKCPC